jgi:hypothetical protein
VLLAKTLRSSTLKLALISIGIFGAVVLVLFGYVYWSTASYVQSRLDRAITAEQAILQRIYERAGSGALVAAIARRIADERLDGRLYLFADPSYAPVAGNLATWPSALKDAKGWITFSTQEWKPDDANRPLRAAFETLPGGSHLLWEETSNISTSSRRGSRRPSPWASC